MITLPFSRVEGAVGVESRTTLRSVYYDAEKKRLAASDGFILAVIPVQAEGDVSGLIPIEAFKEARKLYKKRAYIDASDKTEARIPHDKSPKSAWVRPPNLYPRFDMIVPKESDDSVTVTLDARRLMQLAEALLQEEDRAKRKGVKNHDAWGVSLTFDPQKVGPILVRPLRDTGAVKGRFGVIMPMHKLGKPL